MASLINYKHSGRYLLEIGDAFSQPVKVEVVSDVVLVDFNKKLVALQIAEPLDPAGSRLTRLFIQIFYINKKSVFYARASKDQP